MLSRSISELELKESFRKSTEFYINNKYFLKINKDFSNNLDILIDKGIPETELRKLYEDSRKSDREVLYHFLTQFNYDIYKNTIKDINDVFLKIQDDKKNNKDIPKYDQSNHYSFIFFEKNKNKLNLIENLNKILEENKILSIDSNKLIDFRMNLDKTVDKNTISLKIDKLKKNITDRYFDYKINPFDKNTQHSLRNEKKKIGLNDIIYELKERFDVDVEIEYDNLSKDNLEKENQIHQNVLLDIDKIFQDKLKHFQSKTQDIKLENYQKDYFQKKLEQLNKLKETLSEKLKKTISINKVLIEAKPENTKISLNKDMEELKRIFDEELIVCELKKFKDIIDNYSKENFLLSYQDICEKNSKDFDNYYLALSSNKYAINIDSFVNPSIYQYFELGDITFPFDKNHERTDNICFNELINKFYNYMFNSRVYVELNEMKYEMKKNYSKNAIESTSNCKSDYIRETQKIKDYYFSKIKKQLNI